MEPIFNGFQSIKICVQYMASHSHKPTLYPSNYYYGSNFIRLTGSGNKVEDYTTQNCLELHQYADHDIILNKIQSVLGIIHTMICVYVLRKLQIQPYIASESTDGEILYM